MAFLHDFQKIWRLHNSIPYSHVASTASENHMRVGQGFKNSCCGVLVNISVSPKTRHVTFDVCHRLAITGLSLTKERKKIGTKTTLKKKERGLKIQRGIVKHQFSLQLIHVRVSYKQHHLSWTWRLKLLRMPSIYFVIKLWPFVSNDL